MSYIYYFDIAALFINSIVIFFFYNKKNIATFQNKVFLLILYCLAGCSVLDLVLALQNNYQFFFPSPVLWILNGLQYSLTNIFGLLLATYCLSLVSFYTTQSKFKIRLASCFLIIPTILILAIIWLSPLFYNLFDYSLVFYIDSMGNYHRGDNLFFYLLYYFCIYYVLYSFSIMIRFRKCVAPRAILHLVVYVLFVVFTVLLQLFFPNLLVMCFGMALASLVFLFYIQRPEEVLNPVSECFNNTAFVRIVPQQIVSSNNVCCIAVILDDTYFLANTFGINRLDDFIREIANYLKMIFKSRDVYQMNQGCFCIVLRNVSIVEIQDTIAVLQARFNGIWKCDSIHLKLYSRFLVVNCPKDAKSAEEILEFINLVTNDERYKQSVVYAKDIDLEYKKRTMFIDRTVRLGLADNKMEVYYQPIWSTEKERLIGAEALLRLKDDEGNFISPEDFIPIAEKNGSILRIGEFVFESVCRTLSSIAPAMFGIEKIDINLSVAQCMQDILSEQIMTIRSMYNVPASLINLEITETAAAHTPEILLKNMQNLANAGFELSLDDYGSGYSNMNYMLNLPFKMIKIDKYIVWAAFEDSRAKTALAATIDMINKMGMTVLAEGVENKEQADWLSEQGCDYLQGFYFSKPVTREEFLKIMLKISKTKKKA